MEKSFLKSFVNTTWSQEMNAEALAVSGLDYRHNLTIVSDNCK
jgi:hypothetical protein